MTEKSKTSDPLANNAPELTKPSKRLVELMNWCQSEDVSISKAVREFRKLFDAISDSRERKNFIRNLTFMVQVTHFSELLMTLNTRLHNYILHWGPAIRTTDTEVVRNGDTVRKISLYGYSVPRTGGGGPRLQY